MQPDTEAPQQPVYEPRPTYPVEVTPLPQDPGTEGPEPKEPRSETSFAVQSTVPSTSSALLSKPLDTAPSTPAGLAMPNESQSQPAASNKLPGAPSSQLLKSAGSNLQAVGEPQANQSTDTHREAEPLHGALDPNITIQKEKTRHRFMAHLASQGKTNREIAQEVGMTDAWVSQVTRNDWFKRQVTALMHAVGRNTLEDIFENAAKPAAEKLIELSLRADSESVQLNATSALLDRFLGKPTQHTKSENTNYNHNLSNLEAIHAERDKVKQQLAAIRPSSN